LEPDWSFELSHLSRAWHWSGQCGGEMRIISMILDPAVIRTILDHLRKKREIDPRAPPHATGSFEAAS